MTTKSMFFNLAVCVLYAFAAPTNIRDTTTTTSSTTVAMPVVDVDQLPTIVSSPGVFSSQDDGTPTATTTIGSSGSFKNLYLRIATGVSSGGVIDPGVIPRGDIFTGFDIRPDHQGNFGGVAALSAFTDDSVAAVAQDYTNVNTTPQINAGVITNDQDLTQAMEYSVQAGGMFVGGAASFEASFGYSSKAAASSHQVVGYTVGTVALPGRYLHNITNLKLTDDALQLLQQPDPSEFFSTYGTHFVRTRVYGCQSIASYSYTCKSQSSALDIATSLHANYNGGLVSVGGGVDTKFSQYSKDSICTYNGQTQSSGVGSKSPSSSVMMNSTIMEEYWRDFGNMCQQGAMTDSQLLYIELTGWDNIPEVWNLMQNNTNLRQQIFFYSSMIPEDLEGLAMGMVYQERVSNAVANFPAALAKPYHPLFQSGFFDRMTGEAMAQQPTSDYWQYLCDFHGQVAAQAQSGGWAQYGNSYQVGQAILNNKRFSDIARPFFQGMVKMFQYAAGVYKYSYNSATVTAISFDTDNVTPISAQIVIPVDGFPLGCSQLEPVTGLRVCGSNSNFHAGSLPIEFGLRQLQPQDSSDYNTLQLFVNMNTDGLFTTMADPKTPNSVNYIDLSQIVQTRHCSTCIQPVRIEVSFQYNMPDISLNINSPY